MRIKIPSLLFYFVVAKSFSPPVSGPYPTRCKLTQNTKVANCNFYGETFKLELKQIPANYNVNTNFKPTLVLIYIKRPVLEN